MAEELGNNPSVESSTRGGRKSVDANVRLSVDSKQGLRSVQEFERKLSRLGSIAHQGEYQSNGLLTKKQVQMYRSILKEMESAYSKHQADLSKMEDEYSKKLEHRKKQIQELKRLEQEALSAQNKYSVASGDNPNKRPASQTIQDTLKRERDEAVKRVTTYKESLSGGNSEVSELAKSIDSLKASLNAMSNSRDKADAYSKRINNMRQDNPEAKTLAYSLMNTAAYGTGVMGVRRYAGYVRSGTSTLRHEERLASQISQRSMTGYSDDDYRDEMKRVGEKSNYNAGETLSLQQQIIKGGTTGDKSAISSDTRAYQNYGRAFAVDPNEVAGSGNLLQKMGTLEEGQMQKFADILAGAISKEGMAGREEELLRSTSSLAEKVSQGQAGLSYDQLSQIVGMQTALGDSVSSLKGDAGAHILSNIDSGIKNSDSNFDLLLGKGTEFVGLEGMGNLERAKEQGLSAENIKRIYNNSIDRFQSFDNTMTRYAFKNNLGVSFTEFDAMQKAGYWERIANGDMPTPEELESIGATTTLESLNNYKDSETSRVDRLDAKSSNLKADHSKASDEVAKTSRGLFHGLPGIVKHSALVGTGIFGPSLLRKLGSTLFSSGFGSTPIGGGGGNILGSLLKGGATTGGTATTLTNSALRGLGRLGTVLSNGASATGSTLSSMGINLSTMTNLGTTVGKVVAGGTGIISSVSSYVSDRKENPQTNKMRSVHKAVGTGAGAVGGLAVGTAIGTALAPVTGGLSVPVGALLGAISSYVGGKVGGWVGDKNYSLAKGNDDKVTEVVKNSRANNSKYVSQMFESRLDNESLTESQRKSLTKQQEKYVDKIESATSQEELSKIVKQVTQKLSDFDNSIDKTTKNLDNKQPNSDNKTNKSSTLYSGTMTMPISYYASDNKVKNEENNGKVAYNYGKKSDDSNKQATTITRTSATTSSGVKGAMESVQHYVRIDVGGRIENMNEDNQNEVTKSIKKYFGGIFSGFNLSEDQVRG